MNLPQSGRHLVELMPDESRAILRKRHKADRFDYFATDPDQEVRTLGRLALRRNNVNDLFALGDLCGQRSLTDDGIQNSHAPAEVILDEDAKRPLASRLIGSKDLKTVHKAFHPALLGAVPAPMDQHHGHETGEEHLAGFLQGFKPTYRREIAAQDIDQDVAIEE